MKNKSFLLLSLSLLFTPPMYSQDESGWDKERATTKEIVLDASSTTWSKIDLPVGTTEVAVRVTLPDDNRQLTTSFADLLGSVPLPSAQMASAGTKFLSEIAGNDYCKYYVFQNAQEVNNYFQTYQDNAACFSTPDKVNRDVAFLKGNCLQDNPHYLFFVFNSMNTVQKERIILEVVPWVDGKESRGWTRQIKQKFIDRCVGSEELKEFSNPEEYCQCLLDKFQASYTFQEFEKLIPSEMNKIGPMYGEQCLTETSAGKDIYDAERKRAQKLANDKKYGEAIATMLDVVSHGKPTTSDYNNLGYYYIFSKQYLKAIKYLKEGLKLDDTELLIHGNLAHAYLLNGDIEQAKAIYIKYKAQNVDDKMSWVEMIKLDFADFKKAGLPTDNFQAILDLVK